MPPFQELTAPPAWRSVEIISDLHLQAREPATLDAWRRYMRNTAADALFILGDLFEVWVGDDAALEPGFEADCAAVLQAATARLPVFFLHGNRDFLVGPGLMAASHATLLQDPAVLAFLGRRWLLTHGDALCLADVDYLRFRAKVRSAGWQSAFLARPLQERRAIASGLRDESEQRKQSGMGSGDIDVDADAAGAWLNAAGAEVMVHGHTHRPGDHALPGSRTRIVLSDWDASAAAPRMQALRIDAAGAARIDLS